MVSILTYNYEANMVITCIVTMYVKVMKQNQKKIKEKQNRI